jgi:hypothetical protein
MVRKLISLVKYDSENSIKYSKSDSKSNKSKNEIYDLEYKLKSAVNIIGHLCRCVRLLNTSNVKLTDVDDCLKTAEEFIKNNQ